MPGADGSCSEQACHQLAGLGGIHCEKTCSAEYRKAYRCRSVESCPRSVSSLYGMAATDASRAATLEPTFANAHYRQAKVHLGMRDLPRTRVSLEDGLRHFPGNPPMESLLRELLALGVAEEFSNPFCQAERDQLKQAGVAAMVAVHAYALFAYCTFTIPDKRKRAAETWSRGGARQPQGGLAARGGASIRLPLLRLQSLRRH